MTYVDDLQAERFGKSLWWTKSAERPDIRPDGELIGRKRRKDAETDAYHHDTKTGAA